MDEFRPESSIFFSFGLKVAIALEHKSLRQNAPAQCFFDVVTKRVAAVCLLM